MSVFRVYKTKNFTVMSNYHFEERQMTLKAKGLLSLMLSLPDDWNYSVSGLVALSKDGKDSVITALAELQKFGYLVRKQLYDAKGQFNGVEYHIYEQPQQAIVNKNGGEDTRPLEKPYTKIQELFNSICISLPSVNNLSDSRKEEITARLKKYSLEQFEELFINAENSEFLKGANNRKWVATFDWLIKDENFAKVLDGNFNNIVSSSTNYDDLEELTKTRGDAV